MRRLEHAAIALTLLVAFIADLRFVVPVVLGVLVWWLVRHRADRVESAIGVALLAASTVSFAAGNEVAAWSFALATAVLAGVEVARPTSRVRTG